MQANSDMVLTQVKEIKKYYSTKGKAAETSAENFNSAPRSEDISQNISLEAKTELTDLFNHQMLKLRKDLEVRITEISQRQTKKIMEEKAQSDTLLEGRSAAFTVEIESKIQQQLSTFKELQQKIEK